MTQLTLPLSLPDDETFTSFYAGENTSLIHTLRSVMLDSNCSVIYFWSAIGSGRSHLLHAVCSLAAQQDKTVGFIPLTLFKTLTPAVLEGMEHLSIVCIDDVDAIVGEREWEEALFDFYNRVLENRQTSLIITGNAAPKELGLRLADLTSRLTWGQVYRLSPLSDDDKLHALQLRARLRGFELPEDVGRFLLKRLDRDMRTLLTQLNRLDRATIEAKRKLTIPFVKEILSL